MMLKNCFHIAFNVWPAATILRLWSLGIVLCLSAVACTTKTIPLTPDFDNCGNTLTLASELFRGEPSAAVDTVTGDDKQISAFIACRNLSGSHLLKWEWYTPDRKLYISESIPFSTRTGTFRRNVSAWHSIKIKGEQAELFQGNWRVKVYYDDLPMASATFTLLPSSMYKNSAEAPNPVKSRLESIIDDSTESLPQKRGVITK